MAIILFCTQRSGSQMLTTALDSHPDVEMAPEAYFLLNQTPRDYFKDNQKHKPLSQQKKYSIFEWVSSLKYNQGCGIKYNQINCISSFFSKENKIIHLVRRNIMRTVVSNIINNNKKHFNIPSHFYKKNQKKYSNFLSYEQLLDNVPKNLVIKKEIIESRCASLEKAITLQHKKLKRFENNTITLYYEDLVGDGDILNKDCSIRLCEFLKIDVNHKLFIGTKKTGLDLENVISNYDEIRHMDCEFYLDGE